MQRNPLLAAFLLKAAMWLPLCLAFWYWQAQWLNGPAALLSSWLMHYYFPEWVESAEWAHRTVILATTLKLDITSAVQDGKFAAMVVEANPLIYGYGLPIFVALSLASGDTKRLKKLIFGALILIPFQVWGVCFDLLKQVAITAGPAVNNQLGFDPWQREGIAFGYQLGTLILPTLAPIVIWLSLNRLFIPMLLLEGALQRDDKATTGTID